MDVIRTLGWMTIASAALALLPLAMGIAYAIRPTERRLALARTLSLAAVFAALSGATNGGMNGMRFVSARAPAGLTPAVAMGIADSFFPLFFAFGCLTVAWLCVSIGLWRRTMAG
jgi:hypothetical protein